MIPLEHNLEVALADPLFMLRLFKRVGYGLVPRPHPDADRALLPSFQSIDARYRGSKNIVMDVSTLLAAVTPLFPPTLLAPKEVTLLLHVLTLEDEEEKTSDAAPRPPPKGKGGAPVHGIQPGSVTFALRSMIPFKAWLVSRTVESIRRVVQENAMMSPFEEHLADVLDWRRNKRRQAEEAAPPPLERPEALTFMEGTCALSSSETQLLLQYCVSEEEEREDEEVGQQPLRCDAVLLHQLLFSDVIPGVAEYPLLMGRLAEATLEVVEGENLRTGTLALYSSLSSLELSYPERSRHRAPDLDLGTLVRAELSPRHFFYLCAKLHTGFRQKESDQLYYYLKEKESDDGVLVATILAAYRQYFPPVAFSIMRLVQAAVVQWIRRSAGDDPSFVQLYMTLAEWGADRIPIKSFVQALRAAGVPDGVGGVLDVELEWLRLKAPTRVDLLLALCAPVPPTRLAVIQKAFERLDEASSGSVPCPVVLRLCRPDLIEGSSLRRQVSNWRKALEAYLDEIAEPAIDYEVFAYFWYMISTGVEDDPAFTMALWQAFGLAEGKHRTRHS